MANRSLGPARCRWIPLLALVLATVAATGCLSGDSSPQTASVGPSSLDEARESPGIELGTTEGSTAAEVKLLVPSSEQVDSPGEQPVVVLVHDPDAGEPITDATVSLEARMPAMGHGTGPEEDPTHAGDGIYEGRTTWSMAGEWILNLDVELPDGSSGTFSLDVRVGAHQDVVQDEARDPFEDFGQAMSAPGTVYEGHLVAPANDTATHTDEVSGPYEERFEMETADRPLANVTLRAQLDPGTPADALNLTVFDPDGEAAATVEVTGQSPTGQATIEAADPGAWTVDVTGHAVQGVLEATLEATYEAPHVDVKTLDPIDPTRAVTGDRPFLFLVFDAVESTPVTDATVLYGASQGELDAGAMAQASHAGAGQYAPDSGFAEEGPWNVGIEVQLPTGETYRFPIEAHAYPPGDIPEGGSQDQGGHGHDH